MKKIIPTLLLLCSIVAVGQVKFTDQEYFTLRGGIDPGATIKEKGLPDILLEVEYAGHIYAKLGFEYFAALDPCYADIHGAVGVNLHAGRFEKTRIYGGLRLARIFRGNGGRGELVGFEAGLDYNITEKFFIGLRFTYDYRNDGKTLGWDPYWRENFFITAGIKF